MKRWFLIFLATLCLPLWLCNAVVWVNSLQYTYTWERSTLHPHPMQHWQDTLMIGYGQAFFSRATVSANSIMEFRKLRRHQLPYFHYGFRNVAPPASNLPLNSPWRTLGLEYTHAPGYGMPSVAHTSARAPLWLFQLVFTLPLILWQLKVAYPDSRYRRLSRQGRCGICGYDLRESPVRCPECGTAPAHSATMLSSKFSGIFGASAAGWLLLSIGIGGGYWYSRQQELNTLVQSLSLNSLRWDIGKLGPTQEFYIHEGISNAHRQLKMLPQIQEAARQAAQRMGPIRISIPGTIERVECVYADPHVSEPIRQVCLRCHLPEHASATMQLMPNTGHASCDFASYHIELDVTTEVVVHKVEVIELCDGEMENGEIVATEHDCQNDDIVLGIEYWHTVAGTVSRSDDPSFKNIKIYARYPVMTALFLQPTQAQPVTVKSP